MSRLRTWTVAIGSLVVVLLLGWWAVSAIKAAQRAQLETVPVERVIGQSGADGQYYVFARLEDASGCIPENVRAAEGDGGYEVLTHRHDEGEFISSGPRCEFLSKDDWYISLFVTAADPTGIIIRVNGRSYTIDAEPTSTTAGS